MGSTDALVRSLLDSLPQAVFAVAPDGNVLSWNEGAHELTSSGT
ncbi:MAG TPA: PAS domain-containing protein [Polyangiaceae bacterium]|jgi:PAS domain-containing protein|nr:PAS domain-containing protein [Polyangiaceae bacterium]